MATNGPELVAPACPIYPTADGWITAASPNNPNSDGTAVQVGYIGGGGSTYENRAYLMVPLKGLAPTAVVLKAYLEGVYGDPATITARRVLRAMNALSTWNKYDGVNAWDSAGGSSVGIDYLAAGTVAVTAPAVSNWQSWDLTTQTLAMVGDFVVMLTATPETALNFYTSSEAASNRPYLEVTAALAVPTAFTATAGAHGAVALEWDDNAYAEGGYDIYYGNAAYPTRLLAHVAAGATSYAHTVIPGAWYYTIVARSTTWGDSGSAYANLTTTTVPLPALSFGNGIVAGGKRSDAVRIRSHSGIEYPRNEQAFTEAANLDGGAMGAQRATMRPMAVQLDFGYAYTRPQVSALFTPGIVRTLSSPWGSMPYVMDAGVGFPYENLTGPVVANISMLSEYAYPEGDELTSASTAGPFSSNSDVAAFPEVAVAIGSDASGISLTVDNDYGTTTTVITGSLTTGQVVRIDAKNFTVTVDYLDRIAWFDRDHDWPILAPGTNTVLSIGALGMPQAHTVTWRPRKMGLL